MSDIAVRDPGNIVERVTIVGDLGQLTPAERVSYYQRTCESLGLNPYTRPFDYIRLSGKLTLYAKRDAADQLRRIHGVSITALEKTTEGDLYVVTAHAATADGRTDADMGAVGIKGLAGENLANAMLKAVTKAKRRVTLSISGLGFLDETEVEDIPAAAKRPARPAPNVMLPPHDPHTGELDAIDELTSAALPREPTTAADAPASGMTEPGAGALSFEDLEVMAREAAQRGPDQLKTFFKSRTTAEKAHLRAIEAELVALYPAEIPAE